MYRAAMGILSDCDFGEGIPVRAVIDYGALYRYSVYLRDDEG
jgi:hypothetical protein